MNHCTKHNSKKILVTAKKVQFNQRKCWLHAIQNMKQKKIYNSGINSEIKIQSKWNKSFEKIFKIISKQHADTKNLAKKLNYNKNYVKRSTMKLWQHV